MCVGLSDTLACVCVSAAFPAAYGQISQAFPQPPPIIPQQQREGESVAARYVTCESERFDVVTLCDISRNWLFIDVLLK